MYRLSRPFFFHQNKATLLYLFLFYFFLFALFPSNSFSFEKIDFLFEIGPQIGEDKKNRLKNPADLSISASGDMYVTDSENNRILIFDEEGTYKSTFGERGSKDEQFKNPWGITHDDSGNVYIVDSGNHRVQVYDKNNKYLFSFGRSGKNRGELNSPQGIAIDSQGRVIVADSGNSSICLFTLDGIFLDRLGTKGKADGQFEKPADIAVDSLDNIYVTDEKTAKLQIFSFDLRFLKAYEKANKDDKAFGLPLGVDVDRFGRIYYSDISNKQIHIVGAGDNNASAFGSEGKGRGQFKKPNSLTYDDKTDRLYVADTSNNRMQVFQIGIVDGLSVMPQADSRDQIEFSQTFTTSTNAIATGKDGTLYTLNSKEKKVEKRHPNGTVIAEFGKNENNKSFLGQPESILLTDSGLLYVSDSKNDVIYILDKSGKRLYEIGGRGSKEGSLQNPKGIIALLDGSIAVADSGNNRIQLFNKDGIFLKSFGKKGNSKGKFNNPSDLAVNSMGEIWVTDSGNHRIQVFNREGLHLKTIGSPKLSPESLFYKPVGIDIDRYDNVYIANGRATEIVQVLNSTGEPIYSFGSKGRENNEFNGLTDIHFHFNGGQKLYLIDSGNGRLKMLSLKKAPPSPSGLTIEADELYTELTWLKDKDNLVEKYWVYAKKEGEDFKLLTKIAENTIRIERLKSPGVNNYTISAISFDKLVSKRSDTLTDHFGIGYDYFTDGKYEDAITHFEQVADSGKAVLYLGDSYGALKDYKKTEEAFKKLSKIKTFEEDGLMRLGKVYLLTKKLDSARSAFEAIPKESTKHLLAKRYLGEVNYEKGLYGAALELLTEAFEQGSDDERTCELIGSIYFKLKVFQKALFFYEKALEKDPENPGLHNGLASVYKADGQTEKAISAYNKVIVLDSSNSEAFINLAGLYRAVGQWSYAENAIEAALKLDPESNRALLIKGEILLNKGQDSEAIILFRKILSSDPGNRDALFSIAKSYINIGQADEALQNLEKLSTLRPANTDALLLLAGIQSEKGNVDEAIKNLDLCIEADGEKTACHRLTANIYLALGTLDKAAHHLGLISKLSPEDTSARIELVDTLRKLGKTGEAIVELEDAVRLDRKNAEARYILGQIYMENKQTKKAIEQFYAAVDLEPAKADYLNALGLAYLYEVKITDAIGLFKKAVAIDTKDEYLQNLNRAYDKKKKMLASTEEAPPLTISEIKLDNVFAAAYKNYAENSMGLIKLKNNSDDIFQKIKLSLNVKKYMDFPSETIISELKPHETVEIPVMPTFNNEILKITEDTMIQAEIQVDYFREKKQATLIRTEAFRIYNRNAVTWSEKNMAAAFITPNDLPVVSFARGIIQLFHDSEKVLDENLNKAMQIFDTLGALGVVYLVDPNSAYSDVSLDAQKIDAIQYPRDTLKHKAGDCDDLVVLYSALLENVGVETTMLDIPGHLFMAFKTSTPASDKEKIATTDNLYVIRDDGYVWIPVEVTMVGKSFTEAWYEGAKELKIREKSGELNFIDTHSAWKHFKPVTLEGGKDVALPDKENIVKLLQKDTLLQKRKGVEKLAKKYTDRIKEDPQDYKARLNLAIIYGKNGYEAEALDLFEKMLEENAEDVKVLNNMGNILFNQSDYEGALARYEEAEEAESENAEVKINISLALYKLTKLDKAREKFQEGETISAETASRFSLLKSLLFD